MLCLQEHFVGKFAPVPPSVSLLLLIFFPRGFSVIEKGGRRSVSEIRQLHQLIVQSHQGPRRRGVGEGLAGLQPYHFYCWDLFFQGSRWRANASHKWRNTNLNVCLYWPDFFCPTTLKWSPRSLIAVSFEKRPLLFITVQSPYLMVLLEGLQHILHVPNRWKTLLFSTGEK